MVDMALAVGVVVIGRNEGERLIECFRSMTALAMPIVYVDSASTDGSQEVARAAGAVVVDLDLARPFTASRARREGAATLLAQIPSLKYIQFIDGDCALAAGWVTTAREFLVVASDYGATCGRRRERAASASLYNQMADLEWNTPVGDAKTCGGDSMIRVSAYQAVGGFDAALIAGEEPELCARLRAAEWRIYRLDADMTVHDAAMTRLSQWWNRAVRSGFGYAQAWRTTRAGRYPLYRRELLRAGGWTIGPILLSLIVGVFIHPIGWLIAPAAYVLHIVRLATKFGFGYGFSWHRATLLMISKFAETWGVLRYIKRTLFGGTGETITYK